MADQRAAIPVPSDELARARTELAHRYGSMVVDHEEKRILIVRVPHPQPDPVNDVELAVDFLQPGDVDGITHCLLIGDKAIAQVYARPLQDLMAQRIKEDREITAMLRSRLPGDGHELFQSPTDPRRRWRLGVRLPIERIADLGEHHIDALCEAFGPQLDTPRFKSLCAVYLMAEQDEARLEPDLFLQDIRSQWEDEDRRRRQELARVQAEEAARREKEEERLRIRHEMERRLGPSGAPSLRRESRSNRYSHPVTEPVHDSLDASFASEPGTPEALPAEPVPDMEDLGPAPSRPRDKRGLVIEAESTIVAKPPKANPGGPWAAAADSIEAPQGIDTEVRPVAPAPDVDAARAAIRDLDAVTRAPAARAPTHDDARPSDRSMAGVADPSRQRSIDNDSGLSAEESADLDSHIAGLRNRVERVLGDQPRSDWRARRVERQRRAPMPDPRPSDLPWRDSDRDRRARTSRARLESPIPDPRPGDMPGRDTERDRERRAPMPDPRPGDLPWRDSDRDRSWSVEVRGDLAHRLEGAGFDVLYDPPKGLGIDLAAERPDGDPQRIVVRCAPTLDSETARGLLKTARELDVDAVLCVCEKVIPEGERLLVATKVRVVRADALDRLPF